MASELSEKLVYLKEQIEAFLGPDIGFVLLAAPMTGEEEAGTDMISVYNIDDALVPHGLRALADAIEECNRKEQN